MSRYIEYHDICSAIDNQQDGTGMTYEALAHAMVEIQLAPSIDIVRCAECKYEPICSHSVQHTTHEPTSVTIGYKSVDFCSYGERKESE
jgi:hypothetical protein